jgi:hypothetical protein
MEAQSDLFLGNADKATNLMKSSEMAVYLTQVSGKLGVKLGNRFSANQLMDYFARLKVRCSLSFFSCMMTTRPCRYDTEQT